MAKNGADRAEKSGHVAGGCRSGLVGNLERHASAVLLALLCTFVILSLWGASCDSVTVDEFVYPAIGLYHLRTGDFSLDPVAPPLMKLVGGLPLVLAGARLDTHPQWRTGAAGWEPWLFATKVMTDNANRFVRMYFMARFFPMGLGVLLGVVLFLWARQLWGVLGALLTVFLYVFDPNILGHGRLVTADLAVTCFIVTSCYVLWMLLMKPSWWRAAALGCVVGLALVSKFSAVLLAAILPLEAMVVLMSRRRSRSADGDNAGAGKVRGVGARLLQAAVALAAVILVVNCVYGFSGFLMPLGRLNLHWPVLRWLGRTVPRAALPLPADFLSGMDHKFAEADFGGYPGFLFGKWSDDGFRSYYALSVLLKMPLGALILALASVVWPRGDSASPKWRHVALWMIPVAVFVGAGTLLFYRFNYGLRYILPVVPFIHLGCGRMGAVASDSRAARCLAAVMTLWVLWACVSVTPHHLSYFNELIGGSKNAYRVMVDSNVDWGQDLVHLKSYMGRRGMDQVHLAYFGHVSPALYGIHYVPFHGSERPSGPIAISASLLQGLPYVITYEVDLHRLHSREAFLRAVRPVSPEGFAWLRQRKPTAMVGYSILIFDGIENDAP